MSDLDEFRLRARAWLAAQRPPLDMSWGVGSDSVAVFNSLPVAEEAELIRAACEWQRLKFDAGFGALMAAEADGGAGLDQSYERAFRDEEALIATPPTDEILAVTVELVAPTIVRHGSAFLREKYVRALLRADILCCQLFSEPGAGSDLASLTTSAVIDGDYWVVNGQKVWSSGASHSSLGLLIARTERTYPPHRGLTAFLVPMDTAGIEVRPIRQMTGGHSFNEVFLTDLRIPDNHRLGEVGEGWPVALTTLQYERERTAMTGVYGMRRTFRRILELVEHYDCARDPLVGQQVVRLYAKVTGLELLAARVQESLAAGEPPGAEGSTAKLLWTQALREVDALVEEVLGPELTADSGAWGTFSWSQHVLGSPGYRIAGGTDEIQRGIIAERVLGMPREPKLMVTP